MHVAVVKESFYSYGNTLDQVVWSDVRLQLTGMRSVVRG